MYRILSSKPKDIDICPLVRKYKILPLSWLISLSASVIYKAFAIAGKCPFVMEYILRLFMGRENTFASLSNQILEA